MVGSGLRLSGYQAIRLSSYPEHPRLVTGSVIEIGIGNPTFYSSRHRAHQPVERAGHHVLYCDIDGASAMFANALSF